MAILARLKGFLEGASIPYEVSVHPEAYTSQEIAALLHRSGKQLAKVVMVKAGDAFVMCVLPAHELIDVDRLERVVDRKGTVRIATEEEFKNLFPDCDVGAMPPFGNLYQLPVYLDERLTRYDKIYFEAGNHTEIVTLSLEDYRRSVSPEIAQFGRVCRGKKAA